MSFQLAFKPEHSGKKEGGRVRVGPKQKPFAKPKPPPAPPPTIIRTPLTWVSPFEPEPSPRELVVSNISRLKKTVTMTSTTLSEYVGNAFQLPPGWRMEFDLHGYAKDGDVISVRVRTPNFLSKPIQLLAREWVLFNPSTAERLSRWIGRLEIEEVL